MLYQKQELLVLESYVKMENDMDNLTAEQQWFAVLATRIAAGYASNRYAERTAEQISQVGIEAAKRIISAAKELDK